MSSGWQRNLRAVTRTPTLGARGEGWVIIQVVLLVAIGLAGRLGPAWAGEARVVTSVAGVAFLLAGAWLIRLGSRDLGAALTPLPYPKEGSGLVADGDLCPRPPSHLRRSDRGRVRMGAPDGIDPGGGPGGHPVGLLPRQVRAGGTVARGTVPGLPRVPHQDAPAHPLDRLSSRSRRSTASRNGSVSRSGSASRTESLTP